jgi:hypothetical protein
MKIAFVGDSFCADANRNFDRDEKKNKPTWLSWVELVALNYNAEIMCTGHSGRALFHAYEDLLDIIDEADYIVLCITKEFRIANRRKLGITPTFHGQDLFGKEVAIAASYYYEELMSIDFHFTVHYLLIKEIDKLLQERNKKCIWFFVGAFSLTWSSVDDGFNKYLVGKSYKIKSGPIGDTLLFELYEYNLMCDGISKELRAEYFASEEKEKKEYSSHLNHLNEKNNIHMAKLITDIIDNDDFTLRKIKMKEYFKELDPKDMPWATRR